MPKIRGRRNCKMCDRRIKSGEVAHKISRHDWKSYANGIMEFWLCEKDYAHVLKAVEMAAELNALKPVPALRRLAG